MLSRLRLLILNCHLDRTRAPQTCPHNEASVLFVRVHPTSSTASPGAARTLRCSVPGRQRRSNAITSGAQDVVDAEGRTGRGT